MQNNAFRAVNLLELVERLSAREGEREREGVTLALSKRPRKFGGR